MALLSGLRPARRPLARGHILLALLLAMLCWSATVRPGWAQAVLLPAPAATADEPAEVDTTAALERLVATLEDDQDRAELVAQLRLLLAAQQGTAGEPAEPPTLSAQLMTFLSLRMTAISEQVASLGAVVAELPAFLSWVAEQARDPEVRARWIETVVGALIVIAAALGVRLIAQRILRPTRRRLNQARRNRLGGRVLLLAARLVLDLLPLLAFVLVATLLSGLLDPGPMARRVIVTLVNTILIAAVIIDISRAVLAPRAPDLRILPIGSETAEYLMVWVKRLTYTGAIGIGLAQVMIAMGLGGAAANAILDLVGLLLCGMGIVVVLQNRAAMARLIAGPARPGVWSRIRHAFAEIWHVLAILYLVALFIVWALGIAGGFAYLARATLLTAVIVLGAWLFGTALTGLLRRGFRLRPSLHARFPLLEARANRYLPVLLRIVLAFVAAIATLGVLAVWGVDSFGWLSTDAGRRIAGSILSILLVTLTALIAWEVVSYLIERQLTRTDAAGNLIVRGARTRTLLPLVRNAFLIILSTVAVLIVLSELGLDIAPLLAGAGVVGLAIGFGAQTLVKDVITGLFILFEDQIAVGDVVNAGGHSGLVEALTIRTLQLRDEAGTVHTIPFSAVTTVQNMTRGFSFYVINLRVSYREDTDRLIAVLRDLGAELQKDPVVGALILAPIEVIGVDSFTESAVIVKARIKTLPIKQWDVGRAFNRRLKQRFDELGIRMPYPQATIHLVDDGARPARPAAEPPAAATGTAGA